MSRIPKLAKSGASNLVVLESTCANCGTPLVRTRSRQYYCSLQCRRKYNYQKEAAEKHSRVSLSPTEWELYKKDPQREHEQKDNFVVCRECPEKHAALQRHIIAKHHMTVQEYLKKWGNPPLIAPSVPDKISKKQAGRPRLYARGKKYLGQNVRSKKVSQQEGKTAIKQETAPADDATIAEYKLAGNGVLEIALKVNLTHAAIVQRLKYLGFPPGRKCQFLHGEPITKKHFRDLCDDFHVAAKVVITTLRRNPTSGVNRKVTGNPAWRNATGKLPRWFCDCVYHHLSRRGTEDVLFARYADVVLTVRKQWTNTFCFGYVARWKVRDFLASEIRDLPRLAALLKEPLTGLRTWFEAQNGKVESHDVLTWICEQSRKEVAAWDGIGNADERGIRALMFLWPALKDLLDKRGSRWVAGQRQVSQVIHELLAIDYGATPSRIRQVIAGKVPALDCRTFSSMWEERKAIEARALPPDLATKPDDWKKLVPLLKLDRTLSNSEAQAIAGTKLSLPAMNRVRRYAGVPGPKGRPAKKM